MVEMTGCKEPIVRKLINYENREDGIRFFRKNDSDNEWEDGCFPTFGDMMRLEESDTDPDMPYLADPEEIQSVLDGHQGERGIPQSSSRVNSAPRDTVTASWVNPAGIQEMITRHDMLVEERRFPIDIELDSQGKCQTEVREDQQTEA